MDGLVNSKVALQQTGMAPSEPGSDEARRNELLARVITGKLSVEALCEHQHITPDDVREWLRGFRRVAVEAFDEQLRRTLVGHGAELDESNGSEITVSLSDISIIDWIQAIQLFAKHAVITIRHDDRESRLWCYKGALIDAESGRLAGEAAVHRIVGLDKGRVVTELRRVQRERRIFTSTPGLLLEAARRKDEAVLLRRKLGPLERRFQCAAAARHRPLSGDQALVARFFEEPHRLSDAIDHGELGEIETLEALESLIRMNHLVEASAAADPVRSTSSSESEAGPRSSNSGLPISFVWHSEQEQRSVNLRWAVSTLVMVLTVSLAAWVGAGVSKAPAEPAPAPPAVSSAALQARPVDTYAVEVRTYPADAALEIDGLAVGAGHWFARYTKDGATHELRITAPGYIPARILFVDTPPPLQVRLDPLLALAATEPPTPSVAGEVSAAGARDVSGAARADRQRKKPGSQRRRPYVQIIDGDAPSVPAE
jgi:uncharacterized protein DUF4388